MGEPQVEYDNDQRRKGGRKWVLRAAIFLAVILVCLGGFLIGRDRRTTEDRIAAFEAARAIPDEENAALVYQQIFETSDVGADAPDFFATSKPSATSGPWLSAEHPETAEWLKRHQGTIAKLSEASRKEKCVFRIDLAPGPLQGHMNLMAAMREWAQFLVAAANNDIAEGRIDAGLEKYICVIQISKHLNQQAFLIDLLVGIAVEALAVERVKTLVLEGDIPKEGLDSIERALPVMQVDWKQHVSSILEIERLYAKKNLNFAARLVVLFRNNKWRTTERIQELYDRALAGRRGLHILIALRRYKDEHGQWPASLDDITDLTAAENLVDPINDGSFVYKLTDESFRLYSKGKNKIDEDGDRKSEAADWPIWPPRSRRRK
jgi:hypothetical protein